MNLKSLLLTVCAASVNALTIADYLSDPSNGAQMTWNAINTAGVTTFSAPGTTTFFAPSDAAINALSAAYPDIYTSLMSNSTMLSNLIQCYLI
jgi:hypothetical protein